ncbi:MAG: glycerate kinase [Actinobacteria bacterium]|nr:glycerate kinase [Actinomycetota bacterium]MBW3650166.1 glycerate kinase [Actinomycetota bacterium]
MSLLLAAPDKFRGTATAAQVAAAFCRGAGAAGWRCDPAPVAHGGEGILEALGGRLRRSRVQGPLGEVVDAEWRLLDGSVPTAVIEMARAAGLDLVGGPEWNDPLRASTAGVGQLITAAVAAGARRVIIGAGGSATTDGGQGCLEALGPWGTSGRLAGVQLVVACDVTTRFVDAAQQFAGQKGATPKQVALLTRRLERLAQLYEDTYGVDVRDLAGSGAAGGLAGGLAAVGAELVPGFDLVAEALELPARAEDADLVATGEAFLDEQSFSGEVVGGVLELAAVAGVPALVVAGEILEGLARPAAGDVTVVSLVDEFGREQAWSHTTACIEEVTRRHLGKLGR